MPPMTREDEQRAKLIHRTCVSSAALKPIALFNDEHLLHVRFELT
jgi:hypothetical protein